MYFYLLEQQTDFLKYWTTRKALGDTAPPSPPTFLPTPTPSPLQLYRFPDYLPFCVVDFYGELLVPIVQVF